MSDFLWRSDEVTDVGKTIGHKWEATGISIDSRSVAQGDLFIALAGHNQDGHLFVEKALESGAAAAMVHKIPEGLTNSSLLLVKNTQQAMTNLASLARHRVDAKIIAVTGSVGKTGTKEMLKTVLSGHGMTHATEGNLNNHLGVPISLARMPREADFGIFELGMNHPGEIEPLSHLVSPHIAIITTVEAVHLAHFSSTSQIAEAKAEIFSGISKDGVAVLPRDNPHFDFLCSAASRAGISTIYSFGNHPQSNARLLHHIIDANGTDVSAMISNRKINYRIGIPGRQWAENSLAVFAALDALGINFAGTSKALSEMTAPKGRGKRETIEWGDGEILIIDESYNASPVSMKAAIASLGICPVKAGGRRIAVLGDMLELGTSAPAMHHDLHHAIDEWKIDQIFAAGPNMENLYDALPDKKKGAYAERSDLLAPIVTSAIKANDVIMIKGSAGSHMGKIIDKMHSNQRKA